MPVFIEIEQDDPLFKPFFDWGIAKGRAEGKILGARQLLRSLLESKFGPLPKPVLSRIERSTFERVERLTIKALTAPSLDSVFSTKRR
jgi:hypothetical protein